MSKSYNSTAAKPVAEFCPGDRVTIYRVVITGGSHARGLPSGASVIVQQGVALTNNIVSCSKPASLPPSSAR